jgi:hypothetical protein
MKDEDLRKSTVHKNPEPDTPEPNKLTGNEEDWQDVMIAHFGKDWAFQGYGLVECGSLCDTILFLQEENRDLCQGIETAIDSIKELKAELRQNPLKVVEGLSDKLTTEDE